MSKEGTEEISKGIEKLKTDELGSWADDVPDSKLLVLTAEPTTEVKYYDGLLESLNPVEVQLSTQQADEKSPLYSVNSFEELGLSQELLKGIYAMKFVKPSKVQEKALPLLLKNPPQNMIAQSQSGTGKTAAFTLAMLSRIDVNKTAPQAICLAPARELARQIMDVVNQMGQFAKITTRLALKESDPKGDAIREQIIVGTPGTILELQKRRLLDFKEVKILVLDEADVMLDKQGMGAQSIRVKKLCPNSAQILLFSATFKDEVRDFAHRIVPNPNIITLKREELSIEGIKQFYMECQSPQHKMEILSTLYGLLTIGQSIIFVHSRKTADELQEHMKKEGHTISVLHGGLEPEDRDKVIDEYRKGETKVLISTNVLARGIDILQVSLVVNFDIPLDADNKPDCETYLHRIGRTGRFGRSGVSINFVHDKRSMDNMMAIQNYFGREIVKIPTDNLEVLEEKLKCISK